MGTRKTSVEINEELLAGVQRLLATTTVKETIEKAFLEVLRAQARREEVEVTGTGQTVQLYSRFNCPSVDSEESYPPYNYFGKTLQPAFL